MGGEVDVQSRWDEGSGEEFIAASDNTETVFAERPVTLLSLSSGRRERKPILSVLQCRTVSVGSHVSIPT